MVRSSIPGYIDDTTELNTALSCRLVDGDLRSLAPVSPDSLSVRRSHIHNSKYDRGRQQLRISSHVSRGALQYLVHVAATLFTIQMHNEVDPGLDFGLNWALGLMR